MIKDYIMNEIKRGVTIYAAKGAYDNVERIELVTVLNKNEYALLMKYISEVDKEAFITVATISEVVGMWNAPRRKQKEHVSQ